MVGFCQYGPSPPHASNRYSTPNSYVADQVRSAWDKQSPALIYRQNFECTVKGGRIVASAVSKCLKVFNVQYQIWLYDRLMNRKVPGLLGRAVAFSGILCAASGKQEC